MLGPKMQHLAVSQNVVNFWGVTVKAIDGLQHSFLYELLFAQSLSFKPTCHNAGTSGAGSGTWRLKGNSVLEGSMPVPKPKQGAVAAKRPAASAAAAAAATATSPAKAASGAAPKASGGRLSEYFRKLKSTSGAGTVSRASPVKSLSGKENQSAADMGAPERRTYAKLTLQKTAGKRDLAVGLV